MKVTFIHCPNGLQKFSAAVSAMSAWIKSQGHETSLILCENDITEEEFKADLEALNPGIVAFSAMSFQWVFIQTISKWVKEAKPDVPVMIGGYHPTGSPETTIQCPTVDFVCRGEGEHAFSELLAALESGGDIYNIPNIWAKDRDDPTKFHQNELRPLIHDLDVLPRWDYELFDMDELLAQESKASVYHGKFHLPATTGRGCPYHCTYCCNSELMTLYQNKGSFVRRQSPKKVTDDLHWAVNRYHVDHIEFWDEEFDGPTAMMEEFRDLYRDKVGVPFSIFKTASLGRLENMQLLKEAGCSRILVGVECGNEEFRKKVLKKPLTNAEYIEFFDAVHEMGFETISSNMINLPGETAELARETIELNRRLNPTSLFFFRFVPFEGTELYDVSKDSGFLPDWHDYWYESKRSGLDQPSFPKDDLLRVEEEFRALQAEIEERHASRSFL